jgi:cupin 2 domain-containing protein
LNIENIFEGLAGPQGHEQFQTLFESRGLKIERIVSHSHSSPPGFWYDQAVDEWVIVLRGHAALEFEGGELVDIKEGDYLSIPSRVKHRVARTGPETIWLAVHIRKNSSNRAPNFIKQKRQKERE